MRKILRTTDQPGVYIFYRPGCKCHHAVHTDPLNPNSNNAKWSFNGNLESPTFSPSLLVRWTHYKEDENRNPLPETIVDMVCHSFIRDGKIQYLSDCTHEFKGQTIDLPEVP